MSRRPDPKKGLPRQAQPSILETAFPAWTEEGDKAKAVEKEAPAGADKFEDAVGQVLPPESQPYLDTWKRPEDLVLNMPMVPMLTLKPLPELEGAQTKASKKDTPMVSREADCILFAGHRSFEWLHGVFTAVMSAQKCIKPGEYLWELIHPKDKDGQPYRTPNGKYKVKLFIMDCWRTVVVDDRIPVDLFGRSLLVNARPLQLWPLLLSKAVLKVMAGHRILHLCLPHHASVFNMLTGWPQENLLDPLSGTKVLGGFLFDRLDESVHEAETHEERSAVATTCLIRRSLPARPPPRLIVLGGPSAVGRMPLLRRLVEEFPDKFGLTVSHTSRTPQEHEVHGRDFHFTDVAGVRAAAANAELLEHAAVTGIAGTHLHGTSYATVREVAATGKLCLMALDVQAVRSLTANKRIDGLYIYVAPPSMEELAVRQRGRLKEAASTIAKRIAWAEAQVAKVNEAGKLFDHVVQNVSNEKAVYLDIKEAISSLSPIIRNRLHGLPAYVLDYSDLIAPNLVEKPFLKPVVIAGPNTGERRRLMQQLVDEFPDVFAFPTVHTTRPDNYTALHQVAADGTDLPTAPPPPADVHPNGRRISVTVSPAEFDAAVGSDTYVQHHSDLFRHAMATHRTGVSMAAVREIVQSGLLPLIECEAEGAAMLKARGVECLTIFLNPPSIPEFQERLTTWLSETDEDIARRAELAEAQSAEATSSKVYDHTIINADLDETYEQLKALISRHRPDIIIPPEEQPVPVDPAIAAALPILVLAGPTGAGKQRLSAALMRLCPTKFAIPQRITDRKPGKGDVDGPELAFVAAKDLAKLTADGQLAWSVTGPEKGAETLAISTAAITAITSQQMVAIVELPSEWGNPAARSEGLLKDALWVYVASQHILDDAVNCEEVPESAGDVNLTALVTAAIESGLYSTIIEAHEDIDAVTEARAALSIHVPAIIPPALKPLVIAGPFGIGKRVLLQKLFKVLPGRFAVPVITTTRAKQEGDPDDRSEMVVVPRTSAEAAIAAHHFLLHREVLGHIYGVTHESLKQVQATGIVPVLELDHVEDAVKLRADGFDAVYIFVGMEDAGRLFARIHEEISSNPPLGYELQDAANQFLAVAKAETEASRAEGLFDAWVAHDPEAKDASLSRLAEAVHLHYPTVVSREFVWGYGRALWDPKVRTYGQRPLRAMVLGPAAAGKSTQAELLAEHFGLPHVHVGDLLFEEVAKGTTLGLEAKAFMDASKTVPDKCFFAVLTKRLQEPDCQAKGWLLDGFPHTGEQAATLTAANIVPDKVILLDGEHAILQDRAKFRRIDPTTNRTYHMADSHALSPAIKPLDKDGKVDAEVVARLYPRHDDSPENVAARLKLSDEHMPALRAAYSDVSMRMNGRRPVQEVFEEVKQFLSLEARVPELEVWDSSKLKELSYQLVNTLRYKRQQLVKLRQDDGKTFWVDTLELAGNAHCLLLHHDPAPTHFPTTHQLRRVALETVSRTALMYVDSEEPVEILCSLFTGMHYAFEDVTPTTRRVLLIAGPAAVGKSSIIGLLLADYPAKLCLVPPTTTRPPHKSESNGRPANFVDAATWEGLQGAGTMIGCCSHDSHSYGLGRAELQAAWEANRVAVVEGPLALAAALREAGDVQVTCVYLRLDITALDVRLREQEHREESMLMHEMQLAEVEMGQVAAISQMVEHVFENLTLLRTYHQVKEVAASCWAPLKVQSPGHLVLEHYSWTSPTPGPTAKRLRTLMSNASMLELPRGTHLLRIHADNQFLHAVTFRSRTPVQVKEYRDVLPQHDPGVHIQRTDGEHPSIAPGAAALLLRYNLRVSGPTLLALQLSMSGEDARSATRMILLDNDTGMVRELPGLCLPATRLEVNIKGYCVLALIDTAGRPVSAGAAVKGSATLSAATTSTTTSSTGLPPPGGGLADVDGGAGPSISALGGVEEGSFSLTLTSDIPPAQWADTPVARSEAREVLYTANARGVIGRFLLTAMLPTQLAVLARVSPSLPFRAKVMGVKPGTEVKWGQDAVHTELTEMGSGPSGGRLLLPNLSLVPGKYLVQLSVDPALCPEGLQPDPVSGILPVPLSAKVAFMPTTDEKACTITADDSQQRYFKGVLEAWSAQGVNGGVAAVAGAKAAGAPGKTAPVGKGSAGRQVAAQAAFDRYSQELAEAAKAAAAATATAAVPASAASNPESSCSSSAAAADTTSAQPQKPVVRTLKDGTTTLELQPAAATRLIHMSHSAVVLTAEQIAARQEAAAAAVSAAPERLAAVAGQLGKSKAARSAAAARTASHFSERRSEALQEQKGVLEARAEVMRSLKEALKAASEAAAAEALAALPPAEELVKPLKGAAAAKGKAGGKS